MTNKIENNYNKEMFSNNWHERLQTFSVTIMSDVLKFYEKTLETVSPEIKEIKKRINNELENEESKKNNATLRKNDEINRKRLQQRKKVDLFKV